MNFSLEGKPHIELIKLLKVEGLVATGGEGKIAIQEGHVLVNGEVDQRKRRKLVVGDVVSFGDKEVIVKT